MNNNNNNNNNNENENEFSFSSDTILSSEEQQSIKAIFKGGIKEYAKKIEQHKKEQLEEQKRQEELNNKFKTELGDNYTDIINENKEALKKLNNGSDVNLDDPIELHKVLKAFRDIGNTAKEETQTKNEHRPDVNKKFYPTFTYSSPASISKEEATNKIVEQMKAGKKLLL